LSRLKVFKEKIKKKSKYELIKSLLQAVTVTVVSVVAVVVFMPKSPVASFDQVKAFSHEIIYQVEISDQDNVVENDTLKIILESQLYKHEQSITIGQNFGSFKNLEKNTQYQLKVVYDKGFGEEVLAKQTVQTSDDLIAAIANANLIDSNDYSITYELEIIYGDLTGYQELQIRYAIDYRDELPLFYSTISLFNSPSTVPIEFYVYGDAEFVILLEGTLDSNQIVIDENRLKKPFVLSAYLDIAYYNDTEVAFLIFGDSSHLTEVSYFIDIYLNDNLVKTIEYDIEDDSYHSHDSYYIINKLKPETEYSFIFRAEYQNPHTLRYEEAFFEEVTIKTLNKLIYDIEVIETELNYQVTINLNQDIFDYAYYVFYYYYEGYYTYFTGESFLIEVNQNLFNITFFIQKENFEDFYIEIGLESSSDYSLRKIIERIES